MRLRRRRAARAARWRERVSSASEYWDANERAERSLDTYFPVPPAWREQRGTLAKLLPADDWTTVAKAMQRFEVDPSSKDMLERAHSRDDLTEAWAVARWDSLHGGLADATKAMERHAEIQWSPKAP